MRPRLLTLLALCLLLSSVACPDQNSATAGAPPSTQGTVDPAAPGSSANATGFNWTVPSDWIVETPSNAIRKAQYRIAGEAGDAECIVFYYDSSPGDDPLANAQIWAQQFTLADGRSGKEGLQVDNRTIGGIEALVVSVSGTYQSVFLVKSKPDPPKPGHMLLGAVVNGSGSTGLFKLTGPKATVEAQRPAFDALVASLK